MWGNEKADELAKLGTISEDIRSIPTPQSYIKNQINNKVKLLDQQAWNSNKHPHTDSTIGGRNSEAIKKQINSILINNRNNYRKALHLITGHCALNKYLYRINRSDTNLCPLCDLAEETVSHFLGHCPATAELRNEYLADFYLNISDIFKNNKMTAIINFTNQTKRFIKPEEMDQSGVT